jgi:hypothetical protein
MRNQDGTQENTAGRAGITHTRHTHPARLVVVALTAQVR